MTVPANSLKQSGWRLTTLSVRGETPLRLAADGETLEAEGACVRQSAVRVRVGQTLIFRRSLSSVNAASGIAEVAFDAVMPFGDGDLCEVSLLHDGWVVLREQHAATPRVSRQVQVRAAPGDTLEIRVRPIEGESLSLELECRANWLSPVQRWVATPTTPDEQ